MTPAAGAKMPLPAESAAIAGTPAAATPAGFPATDAWLRRIERSNAPRGRARGNSECAQRRQHHV
eukprot:2845271-Pyramimonas_sp.AAC.1